MTSITLADYRDRLIAQFMVKAVIAEARREHRFRDAHALDMALLRMRSEDNTAALDIPWAVRQPVFEAIRETFEGKPKVLRQRFIQPRTGRRSTPWRQSA